MRLLHIDTLKLHDYASAENAPPYIITSHRWLDGEVSFQEVLRHDRDSTVSAKAGMRKIKAFCDFVKLWRDSYGVPEPPSEPLQIIPSHIWIDTCCINKESSAELQEAITSMFQWYRQAWCCLAFLHDVETASHSPLDVLRSLEQSVWFTRGWTLQELLAPKCVVFLDASWVVVGHKSHHEPLMTLSDEVVTWQHLKLPLNNYLSQITNIDERILWDYTYANDVTFEERLAWMLRRTTTRAEDRAYCMLGICEIYMPLIYGEGKNAMKRMHREIRAEHGVTVRDSGQIQVPQLTPHQRGLHAMTFGSLSVGKAPQAPQPPPELEHEAAMTPNLQALQQQMMAQPGRGTGIGAQGLQRDAAMLWAITKEDKRIYNDVFRALDGFSKGYISCDQALEIFGTSGLNKQDLQRIWTLSDPHNDGRLNPDKFAVAMHLIFRALDGHPVPNQLPAELVAASNPNINSSIGVLVEETDIDSERTHQILEALHGYFTRVRTGHVWADDRGFVNVSDIMSGSKLKNGNVTFDELVAVLKSPAGRSFKIQPTAFANEFSYSPADFEIKLRDGTDDADLERSQSAPGGSSLLPLSAESSSQALQPSPVHTPYNASAPKSVPPNGDGADYAAMINALDDYFARKVDSNDSNTDADVYVHAKDLLQDSELQKRIPTVQDLLAALRSPAGQRFETRVDKGKMITGRFQIRRLPSGSRNTMMENGSNESPAAVAARTMKTHSAKTSVIKHALDSYFALVEAGIIRADGEGFANVGKMMNHRLFNEAGIRLDDIMKYIESDAGQQFEKKDSLGRGNEMDVHHCFLRKKGQWAPPRAAEHLRVL